MPQAKFKGLSSARIRLRQPLLAQILPFTGHGQKCGFVLRTVSSVLPEPLAFYAAAAIMSMSTMSDKGDDPTPHQPTTPPVVPLGERVLEQLGACQDEAALWGQLRQVLADWLPHDALLVGPLDPADPAQFQVRDQQGFQAGTWLDKLPLNEMIDPWERTTGAVRIDDVQATSQRLAESFIRTGLRSLLFVPLGDEDTPQGVVVLAARQPGAFTHVTPAEIDHLRRLLAIPLRNIGCLNQNQLIVARLQAQVAEHERRWAQLREHKNKLLGILAHQLRTPLTSIKGFTQLLARREASGALESTTRYTETVLRQVDRLSQAVNNLLDLEQMESALLDTRRRPLDLAALLQALRSDVLVTGVAQTHPLTWPAPNGTAWVQADEEQLRAALLLLLQRAAHRAPPGHPVVVTLTNPPPASGSPPAALQLRIAGGEPAKAAPVLNTLLSELDLRTVETAVSAPASDLMLYRAQQLLQAGGATLAFQRDSATTVCYTVSFTPLAGEDALAR